MKTWKKILLPVVLLAATVFLYAGDYYRAETPALAALESSEDVQVLLSDDRAIFLPRHPHTGLVFYPGGKVEFSAYAPLMRELAEDGVLCLILRMPLNLAVLDVHAGAGIPEEYPDVPNWYLAGHSLGGSMAATHLAEDSQYQGLILLASYSTADLSHTDADILSIYGSEDGVLNLEKYAQNRENLPADTHEILLEGGNHAQFGSYGRQDGDGTPSLSPEEQLQLTANEILTFLNGANTDEMEP